MIEEAVLPAKAEGENRHTSDTDFAAYLSETAAILDSLLPAEFTPDLSLLDAVLASLRLEPSRMVGGRDPLSDKH
jgi:hypothetical protein